jgi:hypothetical protein
MGGSEWSILSIVAPVLLAAVILFAILKNRKAKGGVDRTERATHDVYDAEERRRRDHEGNDG